MLENLNDEQKEAVGAIRNGPVLVTAGAGTGKTSVLIAAAASLLMSDSNETIAPWQILIVTFTNKAANEIKSRIRVKTSKANEMQWIGTFHSMCLKILRRHSERIGLRKDFLIYDENDQERILKNISIDCENVSESLEKISLIKDKGLSALQNTDQEYVAYNAELKRLGAVDFGDIILLTLKLFQEHPDVLAKYQNQFRYILVDEFQDTNGAQMEFLKFLTDNKDNPNIYCVGDEDQSIYSWRGAEIKNIINFNKIFPTAMVKRLETNYRSTANILGAANSLIKHNVGRFGKILHPSDVSNIGEPVYVLTLPTDKDEAKIIANTILKESSVSKKYNSYAILIRNSSQSRLLEDALNDCGIPYRLIGATKFYERMEIRDAIAYLRLLVFPFDDVSFVRAISKPKRGFGDVAIAKIREIGTCLMDGLRNAKLSSKQRVAADEFLSAFDFDWQNMSPCDAAQTLLDRAGYIKMWHDSKDEQKYERLNNIQDLITNVIAKSDTLPDFLEKAVLMTTDDDEGDIIDGGKNMVNLMTIHAAKGLEFDTVFLPAWEEGNFPSDKAIIKHVDDRKITDELALEEERRLAYVAITRAKKRCVITNAMSRWVYKEVKYNSPSRFISEIDNRFLDFQGGAPRANSYAYAPRSYTPRPAPKQTLVGQLVTHSELGSGVVIADNGAILTVAFGNRGIKNVARDYVKISD